MASAGSLRKQWNDLPSNRGRALFPQSLWMLWTCTRTMQQYTNMAPKRARGLSPDAQTGTERVSKSTTFRKAPWIASNPLVVKNATVDKRRQPSAIRGLRTELALRIRGYLQEGNMSRSMVLLCCPQELSQLTRSSMSTSVADRVNVGKTGLFKG